MQHNKLSLLHLWRNPMRNSSISFWGLNRRCYVCHNCNLEKIFYEIILLARVNCLNSILIFKYDTALLPGASGVLGYPFWGILQDWKLWGKETLKKRNRGNWKVHRNLDVTLKIVYRIWNFKQHCISTLFISTVILGNCS